MRSPRPWTARLRHRFLSRTVRGTGCATNSFARPSIRRSLRASVVDCTRRIAEALAAERRPDVVALARHWYDANETDPGCARRTSRQLRSRSVLHAPGEAFAYLERVLEHFDALPADRATAIGGRASLLSQGRRSSASRRRCISGRSPWSRNLSTWRTNRLLWQFAGNGSVSTAGSAGMEPVPGRRTRCRWRCFPTTRRPSPRPSALRLCRLPHDGQPNG